MEGVQHNRARARPGPGGEREERARLSRRQRWVLGQLGLPVWQLRPTAGELQAQATAGADPAAAEPAFTASTPAPEARSPVPPRPDVAGDEIRVGESPAPQQPSPDPARTAARAATAPPQPQPRLDLVCVRQSGVLLLAPAAAVGPEEALVRDLMGAAGALLDTPLAQPEEFRFFWPQPGSRGTPERALAAFIDKRLHDAGARLLLLCESTAPWVPQPPAQALALPALEVLALDPQRKRAIWQQLWQRQQAISH